MRHHPRMKAPTLHTSPRRGPRHVGRALLSVLGSILLTVVSLPLPALAADNDAELTVEQFVAEHQGEVPTYTPGDRFSLTVNVQCSSVETGYCLDARIVDELPEPLAFDTTPVSVTPNVASGTVDGRTLTVSFSGKGLEAGLVATATINVVLPTDASGDFDGHSIRNTVTISADNADPVSDTAVVKLSVPTRLSAHATAAASPDQTIPALPGRSATLTLGGRNSSNVSVDSLRLVAPAPGGDSPFAYLGVTGLRDLEVPAGATRVALDWYDGSDWHDGSAVAVPEDPSDLLPADPGRIAGLRLTFTGAGAKALPPGATGGVAVLTTSRDAFGALAAEETIEVDNPVGAVVTRDAETASDQATSSLTFQKKPVQVALSREYSASQIVAGRTATVTLTAVNGVMPVTRLEVSEPAAGADDLAAQGLVFAGFVTDPDASRQVGWPSGATLAEVTYRYTEGDPQTVATSTPDTLPAPDPDRRVAGFTVVFTGPDDGIDSRATAVLPYTVTAGPVGEEAGVTVTGTASARATSSTPDSGDATADATVTLVPLRVRTSTTKAFSRATIWATPGTTNTVSLTSRVTQSSTIGAEYLQADDLDAGFWDYFDLRRVHSTDIPANAVLTVSAWDGTSWQPLADPVPGPVSDWSFTPSDLQRSSLAGLRFRFTPKDDSSLLPAGFTVAPRFDVTLRRVLRSDPGIATTGGPTDVPVSDTASTEAGNTVAIQPVASSAGADQMLLRPTSSGGGGGSLWLVSKRWVDPIGGEQVDGTNVSALTDDTRTAVLAWGTDGLSLSSMEVVDDPSYLSPATSFYDAFDLVRIRPITTALDPRIGQDRVSRVELFSSSAGDWVDITAQACPSPAACDGVFAGYSLTEAQRATTLAVRLTFAPGSASDTGVIALSPGADRQLRFDYQLRRTLRSDSSRYVLGDSHGYSYNSGHAGTVSNRVRATGTLSEPDQQGATTVTTADSSSITILDQPLNVSLTKSLDQAQLGLPQLETTAAGDYPLVRATLVATNNTASHVPQLTVSDPSPAVSGPGAYDRLNLFQIQLPEIPDDLSTEDVVVVLSLADGSTRELGAADALALQPADLLDVVGVTVRYGAEANLADPGRPLLAPGARATVVLTYQLRSHLRSEPATLVADRDTITNTARAELHSPGGISCSDEEGCDQPTADASGSLGIVQPSYAVSATKSINWTTRYEDQSGTGYVVTLTGQPDGTARTKLLTLTDAAPTFWNAFDLSSLPPISVPAPVNELRLSVLTGVTYRLVDGQLVAECAGSADLAGCWRAGAWHAADEDGQLTPALPDGVTTAQVRGVRFEARRNEDGTVVQWERPANPVLVVRLNLARRATLVLGPDEATDTPVPTTRLGQPTAPGESAPGVFTDTADVTGVAGWMDNLAPYTASARASATTTLRHRVNQVKVEKLPGQGTGSVAPRYDLDATIPYQLKVTNTGSWAMTGLALADHIDLIGGSSPLVAADVSPAFTVKLNGAVVTGATTSLDTATGDLAIGLPGGFVLPPGSVLVVSTNLRFRDRLERGSVVTNTVRVTAARPFEKCEFTTDAKAQAALADVDECSASTTVVTAASTPMTVGTSVKGDGAGVEGAAPGDANYDDLGVIAVGASDSSACDVPNADGFYSYPCVPITRPGGTQTWQLTVANNGNVAANTISAIDVLPAVGDTGVIVGSSRKSRFSPVLLGNVTADLPGDAAAHTLRTFYTTTVLGASCNKADILNDTKPAGQDGCGIEWHEFTTATAASALATAKAVKFLLTFDDPAEGLAPGEKLSLRFDTRTPAHADLGDTSTVDPAAWNSAAIGSRTADSETYPARASLVTEPRKAGVALAGGQLDLSKLVVAPAGAGWLGLLPSGYEATLACTAGGEPFALRGTSTGSDASSVTLAADGTVLRVNGSTTAVNLPLGAECTLAETPVQGAEVGYSTASAVAGRSYTGVPNVAHPWAGTTPGAITVTNTFREAGFTVTKAVTGEVARDAAGQPVHFKDFQFEAGCRFLGGEALPEGDRTFTLRDGESHVVAGLPAGADCTVEETYGAGAATTRSRVVQGAALDEDRDGTVADWTLVAGDASATSVTVANDYTTGAVRITKELAGSGAALWADQAFEAALTCTSDDADPAVVYTARHVLTRDDPAWTVRDLPTGADCTVTETRTGGANDSTVTGGSLLVGDDPDGPAEVTITNRFGSGTVTVAKRLLANGVATSASPWGDAGYPVTLACTRTVDGEEQPVPVPGGATRQLTAANGWLATYADLPAGATCSATEGEVALEPTQPAPAVSISGPVTVVEGSPAPITVTNDFPAGTLVVAKTLRGVGTGFFTGARFDVSCTLAGHAAPVFTRAGITVTAPSMASAALGPIPFGAECTVSEAGTGGADATPVDQVVTIRPDAGSGDVTTVTVENSFSAGTVTVGKVLAGPAAGESWATGATFTLAVTCTSREDGPYSYQGTVSVTGGHSVTLTDADGHPRLFPVGTHCWATETGTGGAVSSVVDHDSFATAAVVAASPDAVQSLSITATNTYTYGGFTVTKDVVTGGATDATGTPLVYSPTFGFTARCTFNGSTVLDTTFSLAKQGDGTWPSRPFDHLPTGASCTVTETGTASATTTQVRLTQDGATGAAITAATTTFALREGDATASIAGFSNAYGVGSATIRKVVSGTGVAWATAPFTVHLECTASGFITGTVYAKDFSFTKDSLGPVTVENLPTGAACQVTETGTGGANSVALANGTFTVGTGTTAVVVTNTFNAGTVRVTKALRANSATTTAKPWSTGSYSMTLSCTRTVNGTAETLDLGASATKTVTGAGSATWTGLPQGATCGATETAIAYPVGTPDQPVPVSTTYGAAVVVGNGSTVTQTVTNNFAFGGVQISKQLTGEAAAAYASGTFSFDVSCTLAGATGAVFSRTGVTLKRSGTETTLTSAAIVPIPAGASCTVTESGTAGATSVTPATRTVALDPVQAGANQVASFANEFRYGGFTVTKAVDDGGAVDASGTPVPYAGTVTFSASCLFNGAEVVPLADRTFSLSRTGDGTWTSKAFSQLPSGASCTVTETGTAAAASTSVRVTQGASTLVDATATTTGAFTLATGDATATAVAYTNHYTTGGLDIGKQVAGTGAAAWGTGTFTLGLSCTLDHDANAGTAPLTVFSASHQLTAGQAWSVRHLPTGASCAVTETASAGANATSLANATPTITAATQAVTVTNTFNTGSVRVTKALAVDGVPTAAEPWASGRYTMTLTCARDFDGDGTAETLTLPDAVRVVSGGGSATWSGLPEGASCSVSESGIAYPDDTPDQPVPSSTTTSGAVTVGNATTADVTVTNDFAYGSVRITKDLTGPAAATYAWAPFTFDVECTLAGTPGTVFSRSDVVLQRAGTESALASAAIGPVPQGAVCTVTETGTGGATTVTPGSRTVTLEPVVAGGVRTAGFANDFAFAGFTVTKTIDNGGALDAAGNPLAYAGTASFTASCLFNGTEVVPPADRSFTLTGGASKAFSELPSGAACTVAETATAGAASTRVTVSQGAATPVDATATSTGAFALVAGDATATAVGFTNTYTTGGLDITKATAGAGATLWGGGTFTIGLSCTLDHDANAGTAAISVFSATTPLQKGQTWSVRHLPTGAKCTVTEPKAGGANSTSISAASPTVSAANQAITVTNTFTVGSVRVVKALRANGASTSAQPWSAGSYPVTLSCRKDFDNDGTAEALTIANASQTITGAGSYTWTNLPQGATCTVAEGTSVVTAQPQPTATVTGTSGANVTVGGSLQTLTLTNSFTAGKLVVHKDITGDGAAWGTGPFRFGVGCTLAGVGTVFSTTLTLTPTGGQTSLDSAALGPIPVGSVCTVTETTTGGATSVASPEPVTIALNAATSDVTTVSVSNEFRLAGFTVTKAVDIGGATDASGTPIAYRRAAFTASCTFEGSEVVRPEDRSFALGAGESRQFSGLPSGAACRVSETDVAGAASTATAITRAGSPVADTDPAPLVAGFTLASGDATATTVAFTNTYTTGSVRVSKALAGDGAALWADPSFGARLSCTLADATTPTVYDAAHQLRVGEPWVVEDLPTGASCTVTEPEPGAATATTITPGSFTVGTGQSQVEVENLYSLGAIRVAKHLTLDGVPTSATPWTSGSYTVELSCTRSVNGVDTAIEIPGGANRVITGAGTAVFDDLPTGATCAVRETGSSPASQEVSVSPATVTVGSDPDEPEAVTVTNDVHTASLTVRKQLGGAGADSFGDGPFSFGVTCTLAGAGEVFHDTATVARPDGSSATSLTSAPLGPVPVGAVCTVTETASAGADAVPDPVTLTVAEDDAANIAAFTNRFSAGTVWLSKHLAGAAATEPWATGARFTVDVTCQAEVDGLRGTVFSRRVTLAGGERVNVTDGEGNPSRVPLGSHCFATEVDAQGAGTSEVPRHDYDTAAVVTAGTPEELQDLDLEVTNGFEYAGLTVAKTVDDGGAVDASGAPVARPAAYGFTTTCTLSGRTVLDAAFTLHGGESRAFAHLPAGASCHVAETDAGRAAHTTVTVTEGGGTTASVPAGAAELVLRRGVVPASADDPAANRVDVVNTYDTGAVTITKQVVGDGASDWGNGGFDVRLSCTLDTDADPDTPATAVYNLTRTLSKASPSWTVTDLPTGASCAVEEVADGGATSHTGPQVVEVGDDPASPVEVGITNHFGTGAVRVTKSFTVDGDVPRAGWADQLATGSYDVRLACSREVNGTTLDVPIPGGSDRTLDATGGWATLYTGLPVGASCAASEVAATPQPHGVTTSAASVTVPATDTPADLGLTNDYRTGSLVVAKEVTGPGASFGDGPFGLEVRCTLAGLAEPVYTGSLELGAGHLTSAPLGPVPVGAECTVTETGTGGATTPAEPVRVVIPDDAAVANTVTATLANDFQLGGFRVSKAVDDGGATDADGQPVPYPGRYAFNVACRFDGEALDLPAGDAAFTLAAGEYREVGGLPRGASCTVSETGTGAAAATTIAVGESTAVAATTVGLTVAEVPVAVAVTNHYAVGALSITKQVTGPGADAWGAGPFTLHAVCTLDTDSDVATPDATVYDAVRQVTRAEPDWSVTHLPAGARCTVTETATGGATTPSAPVEAVVGSDPDAPVRVVVANSFDTGAVRVSKSILVDGQPSDAEPYASAEYHVALACTREVNGETVAVDVPGDEAAAGDPGDGVRTITGAGSVTYSGLPAGAECSASEASASLPLPSAQVSVDHERVTIPAGGTAGITVANDYHTGLLVVTKALAGDGAAAWADQEFDVDVACVLADSTGTEHPVFTASGLILSRAAGLSSGPLGPIPVGAACLVTETAAGGADEPASPQRATIIDGPATEVTLTNGFGEGSVEVGVQLTLDGAATAAAPYSGARYTVGLTCTREVNGATIEVPVPGGGSWTSVGAGTHTFTGLPAGAECTVGQSAASLPPQSVSYDPASSPRGRAVAAFGTTGFGVSGAVVVPSGATPARVTVSEEFLTSTLTVRKVLSGEGAEVHGDRPYAFAIGCTLAEDGVDVAHEVFSTTIALSREAGLVSGPLGPVPVGADCTIAETADGGASTAAEPVTVAIGVDAGANTASLTNTFEVGTVTITKRITVDGQSSTAEPYASGTYTVRLDCTRVVDGEVLPVTVPGGNTRTITGAGSVDIAGLPLGASCQVSETASSLALPSDQVGVSPRTLTVRAEPVTVEVTNDYRSGTLTLRWRLSGVGVGFAGEARFSVDCTLAGADGPVYRRELTLNPVPGSSLVESEPLGPIPVGSQCQVTQYTADGANTLAVPVSVAGQATAVLAELANEYSAGSVKVVNRIVGAGAGEHRRTRFTVDVTCAASATSEPFYSGSLTISGSGTAQVLDGAGQPLLLPAGTRCWARQTSDGGAAWSSVDRGSFARAAVVVTDDADAVQVLTITVTNRFPAAVDALAWTGTGVAGPAALALLSLALGVALLRTRREGAG